MLNHPLFQIVMIAAVLAGLAWLLPPHDHVWPYLTLSWAVASGLILLHARSLGPIGAPFRRHLAVAMAIGLLACGLGYLASVHMADQRRIRVEQAAEIELYSLLHDYALRFQSARAVNPGADILPILNEDQRPRSVYVAARLTPEGHIQIVGQSMGITGWNLDFPNYDQHRGHMQAVLTLAGKDMAYERQN